MTMQDTDIDTPATEDAPAPLPAIDQALLARIVEAALLAAPQPLNLVQLNGLFPLDAPAPDGAVRQALADLAAACEGRGVELVEVASGWRYQVRAEVHPWVARMWTERQTRYTRATLETLALIAYRQPITRGEIEQVRGVTINSAIIKALEERDWIRVVGHRDVPGKPELLATTRTFLDYFGLKTLEDLPPLAQLREIGDPDPQLPFDPAIPATAASGDAEAPVDAASARAASDPGDAEPASDGEDDAAPAASDDTPDAGAAPAFDDDDNHGAPRASRENDDE